MFCSSCGTSQDSQARFCGSCGAALASTEQRPLPLAQPLPPAMSPNSVAATPAGRSPAARVAIAAAIGIAVWLLLQFAIIPALTGGAVFGEYTIKGSDVEANIEETYSTENDLQVDAVCPATMKGKAGATFICSVDVGIIVKDATVTINSDGGFSWKVKAGLN